MKEKFIDITEYDLEKNFFIVKKLSPTDKKRLHHYMYHSNKIPQYNSQFGLVIRRIDVENALMHKGKNANLRQLGYGIDFSQKSRLNCIYRRIKDLNNTNSKIVRNSNIQRYTDELGYTYINLFDYAQQQIKLLARKFECSQYEVRGALYEILRKQYHKTSQLQEKERNEILYFGLNKEDDSDEGEENNDNE